MKKLKRALEVGLQRLEAMDGELHALPQELDRLEAMANRRWDAACIDAGVVGMRLEREQLLRDETRAQSSHGYGQLVQYGVYGLFCLFKRRRWSWQEASTIVDGEQPFKDVRIGLRDNEVKAIAVSAVARHYRVSVSQAVAMLQKEGWRLYTRDEFLGLGREMKRLVEQGKLQIRQAQERRLLESG